MVMFTWRDCPSCAGMREYFLRNRERINMQVLFVPIAGGAGYDRAALDMLGIRPGEESAGVLEKLRASTEMLGSRTGGIRVPHSRGGRRTARFISGIPVERSSA